MYEWNEEEKKIDFSHNPFSMPQGGLEALQYGAPPHGGIAPGIDRIVMLLAGATNLRDVIMFPMNQQAQDLLMGAPSEVTPKQLRELHIRVVPPERKA